MILLLLILKTLFKFLKYYSDFLISLEFPYDDMEGYLLDVNTLALWRYPPPKCGISISVVPPGCAEEPKRADLTWRQCFISINRHKMLCKFREKLPEEIK